MTAAEYLDQLDALRAKSLSPLRNGYPSTPDLAQEAEYPSDIEWIWSDGGHSGAAECFGANTAAVIVAAVNALPQLTAAIRAVLELHPPVPKYVAETADVTACAVCFDEDEIPEDWPCRTVQAITATLQPAQDES